MIHMKDEIIAPASELRIVMDSEGTVATPMQSPRSRLLLSCGKSILAMAQKAYQRVEKMDGRMGCMARGVSGMAAPILNPLQLKCFSVLSLVDRQIVVIQDVTIIVFPPIKFIFRMVDELVLFVESLPVMLDGAIDGLGVLVGDVMSGIMKFVPTRSRISEEEGIVRDIWCDDGSIGECKCIKMGYDDEEGVLRPAMGDETEELEKRCEDVTEKMERVEIVTVEINDGEGETGDVLKTIDISSAEEEIIEGTKYNAHAMHPSAEGTHLGPSKETTDDDVKQDAHQMAIYPEMEELGSMYDVTVKTLNVESQGSCSVTEEVNSIKCDAASCCGQQCAEGLEQEQDGHSTENEETERHSEEFVAALDSMEIFKVESHGCASKEGRREGGNSKRGEDSQQEQEQDALLKLFDERWELKLL